MRKSLITIGLAAASLAAVAALAGCGTAAASHAAPARSAPAATAPAATTPQALAVSDWWNTTGHRDTDTVQADLLKITGDFHSGDPVAVGLVADGQQLAADAGTAGQDQVAAMNADALRNAGSPGGWANPQAAKVFQGYVAAMGQFIAAGEAVQEPPPATAYSGFLSAGYAHLDQVNADLTGFGLPPSIKPSIDSPNA